MFYHTQNPQFYFNFNF